MIIKLRGTAIRFWKGTKNRAKKGDKENIKD
jgi:hypothetical protein